MSNSFAKTAAALTLCLVASTVQADLVLGLSFDDLTTSKTVTSGSSVFVDLFLTDTDGSTPLTSDGLLTGGGAIDVTAGTAGVGHVATTAALGWDAATLVSPVLGAPGIASVLVNAPTIPFPPFVFPVGIGATVVQIARFELAITGAAGETATISSEVLGGIFTGNQSLDTTDLSALPVDLDALLTGTGSVDVTIAGAAAAVPEASTLLVAGLLGVGVLYRRRRKPNAAARA